MEMESLNIPKRLTFTGCISFFIYCLSCSPSHRAFLLEMEQVSEVLGEEFRRLQFRWKPSFL